MRMIVGAMLIGALCAGCGERPTSEVSQAPAATSTPAPGPKNAMAACDPNPKVTVTFKTNDDNILGSPACDLMDIDPDNVLVCHEDSKITWKYVNYCGLAVKASIGKHRRQKYGRFKLDKEIDPLVNDGDFQDEKTIAKAVGTTPTTLLVSAKVKSPAQCPDGLYKYDIGGSVKVDPEIAIRRESK